MATYKIAGFIVRTLFSHASVEREFAAYEIPEPGYADVTVGIKEVGDPGAPTIPQPVEHDPYKAIASDGEGCYFVYKKSRHIAFSVLSFRQGLDRAVISIYLDNEENLADVPRYEIRNAIMHPFFECLFEKERFPLHSCGLSLAGRGILISGASGSGKSSIGKVLVAKYGAEYVGEDINVCSVDGCFWGTPFSHINNNKTASQDVVVFLGETTKRLGLPELKEELLASEFATRGLFSCRHAAERVAAFIADRANCFMVSRSGQTEEETASLVYGLAFGREVF